MKERYMGVAKTQEAKWAIKILLALESINMN